MLALGFAVRCYSVAFQSRLLSDSKRQGERQTDNKQIARTRLSLGLNYLQRGETSQARFNLEKARELAPDLPGSVQRYGLLLSTGWRV